MNNTAIEIRDLGKRYRLGGCQKIHQTLPEMVDQTIRRATRWLGGSRKPETSCANDFWALRNVSFDVEPGEVIGIIGRNGAGKSTLLKILSRITQPTEGRATIRGRVASLLEVGTGFHPELTGRENIYLNGSILGMKHREIKAKFDQIVEFSGIEKFLDTPIKRYSSGMTVRLAFSVAAHLEPEVLITDEVLAVGDIAFQKKCLGKMGEVARGGRTVLFVSHNMSAVSSLCSRCLFLDRGRVVEIADTPRVVERYQAGLDSTLSVPLIDRVDRRGSGDMRFVHLAIEADNADNRRVTSGTPTLVRMQTQSPDGLQMRNVDIWVRITDSWGNPLLTCITSFVEERFETLPSEADVTCKIPRLPLGPGEYRIDLRAMVEGKEADFVESAGKFTVHAGDFFGTWRVSESHKHGPFLVDHNWTVVESSGCVHDSPPQRPAPPMPEIEVPPVAAMTQEQTRRRNAAA